MNSQELLEARNRFRDRIDSLESDSKRCFWNIKEQGAPGPSYFPPVMYAFATVDYFSSFWAGWSDLDVRKYKIKNGNTLLKADTGGQTKRMSDFLEKYLLYPQKESQISIKTWRHSLMHTAEPKTLTEIIVDPKTGAKQVFKYFWRTGVPVQKHMILQPIPNKLDEFLLEFCVFDFIKDLRDGVFGQKGYFEELKIIQTLQALYKECLNEFENTSFVFKP